MAKDIDEIERELAEWARNNGHIDANGNFTEKGRLTFRQSFLDKAQAERYFAGLGQVNSTFAAQLQVAVKELEQIASKETEQPYKWLTTMFHECANHDVSIIGLMINIFRVVDAIAMNHADMHKDFKELVSAFNRSEQDGKAQLVRLQEKLEEQEKEMEKGRPYMKWFMGELPEIEKVDRK